MELTTEMVGKLSTLLGVDNIDTPEVLLSAATKIVEENIAFIGERDAAKSEVATLTAKVTELSAAGVKGEVLELSAASPMGLADRVELAASKIAAAVAKSDIPVHLGNALRDEFASETDPDLLMLSRDPTTKKSPLDRILKLFDGAKLGVPTGDARTGVQTLSRQEPPSVDDKPGDKPADQKQLDAYLAQTPAGQAVLAARKAK